MTLDYDRSGYVAPSSSVLLVRNGSHCFLSHIEQVPVDSYNFDYTPNM